MNTKTKKGFTLTELIIVVVIIGILAAVLIPTLTACVKKAKISNDKQLVRNLNLALSTDSLANRDGEKHKNMQEALDAAEIAGYIVDRINATKADNEILWDSENDVFCYLNDGHIEYIPSSVSSGDELDDDNPVHAVKLWQIVKLTSGNLTENKFSVYAAPGSVVAEIETNKGFDAGTLQFPSVSYDRTGADEDQNGHQVIIRTNSASTTLTINAPLDTVNHYGEVGKVDAQKIDMDCYNEYGKAAYIKVVEGKVVAKAGGKIEVVFAANNDKDAVAVIKETNGTIERGLTVIQPVSDTNEARTNGIPLEYSIDGETAASKTAEELATALTTRTEEVQEIAQEAINTAIENTVFAGVAISKAGEATQLMTIEAFRDAVNADNTYAGYTVKLLDNINLENVEWTPLKLFAGTFDGNNKIISNLTIESNVNKADLGLFAQTENAEIKNLTLSNFKIRDTGSSKSANSGALIGTAKNGLSLSRITVDSKTEVSGKKNGGIVGNVKCSKACQYFFDRCDSSATITGERCGGIVGQINPANSGYDNNFGFDIFTSCSFDGTLNANTGSQPIAGGIVAQYTGGNPEYLTHGLYNCSVNNTNISSNLTKGSFIGFSQSGLSFFNCKLNDNDVTVPVPYLSGGRYGYQAFSINGTIYMIKGSNGTSDNKEDYPNLTAEYDEQCTCTVKANQQVDKFYFNGEQVSGTLQVWYKVTNLYVDMAGNAIFSSDSSVVFKGSMPTSLEEGTKLQRRTYVAGYNYSVRQYTYGFDMWRIVDNSVTAEGTGFGQWQDVDNDGSTGFVLGLGIYYYLDPTDFVDAELYDVSSRETSDYWMIYTVTAK